MSGYETQPADASGEFDIGADAPGVWLGDGAMQIPKIAVIYRSEAGHDHNLQPAERGEKGRTCSASSM